MDGPQASQKFCRSQNDEASLFLHEGLKHKDPKVGVRFLNFLWVESPKSGCKETILEQGLVAATYANNSVSQNSGQQILPDTDLSGNAKPPQPEAVPRATIITEPKPVKRR